MLPLPTALHKGPFARQLFQNTAKGCGDVFKLHLLSPLQEVPQFVFSTLIWVAMNHLAAWQIAAVVISPTFGILAAMLRRGQKPPLSLLYVGIPSSALGAGLAFALFNYGGLAFEWLRDAVGLYSAQGLIAVSVVAAGFIAFFFKQKSQVWYGVCEVFFASVSALKIALSMKPGDTVTSQWVALVGAVYVVSRGLNNISDGRKHKNQIKAL